MNRRTFLLLAAAAFVPLAAPAQEKVDLRVVNLIKNEAFENSKVMDHVFHLTEVIGPRLTGSPAYQAAGDWAVKQLQGWGCANVKQEKWGPFGKGWSASRFVANQVQPYFAPLLAFPLAWAPGTGGPVSAEVVMVQIPTGDDAAFQKALEGFRGKLRGKIVLMDPARDLGLATDPPARRYTDAQLAEMSLAPTPGPRFGPGGPGRPGGPGGGRERVNKRNQFFREEGVAVMVIPGMRGDGGIIFGASAGSRDAKDPVPPPAVALAPEDYNRVARLAGRKIPVRLEFDIQARFHDDTTDTFNVIGEIPGGGKRDEVVMVGGHLDSWTGGTGATDDATGCAVALEVMRILKTLNLKLDRTVRVALWAAEEQGLLGSRAYVTEHFADRATMALKPEHAKLSAYFNLDNGAGKIRGVYLQGNDMVRPIFAAWLEPFRDLGATTLSIRNTGGTDHLPFDAVGLPGFQFIQDPLDYSTRVHHSNMDVYDRVPPGDMMQAAAIMTSFVYHAATRPEMLPRKPLPKPEPKKTD